MGRVMSETERNGQDECSSRLSCWVAVSEQCPPDEQIVLCWNGFQYYVDFCCRYSKPKVGIEWDNDDGPPTHWMALPEAPDTR